MFETIEAVWSELCSKSTRSKISSDASPKTQKIWKSLSNEPLLSTTPWISIFRFSRRLSKMIQIRQGRKQLESRFKKHSKGYFFREATGSLFSSSVEVTDVVVKVAMSMFLIGKLTKVGFFSTNLRKNTRVNCASTKQTKGGNQLFSENRWMWNIR